MGSYANSRPKRANPTPGAGRPRELREAVLGYVPADTAQLAFDLAAEGADQTAYCEYDGKTFRPLSPEEQEEALAAGERLRMRAKPQDRASPDKVQQILNEALKGNLDDR